MKKILLTSAGFDNKKVADKFLELVNKPVIISRNKGENDWSRV